MPAFRAMRMIRGTGLAVTALSIWCCPAGAADAPWRPVFAALDLDGDGRLTAAEREPVRAFDLDDDGIVTEEELRTGLRRLAEGVGGKWLSEFAGLDADGNGTLAGAEAAGLDRAIYDFDGEGRLSAEAFVAGRRREQAARLDLGAGRVVVVSDNSRPIWVRVSDTLRFPLMPGRGATVIPRVHGPAVVAGICEEATLRKSEALVPIVGGGDDGGTRVVEGRRVRVVPILVPADPAERERRIDVAITGPGDVTVDIVVVPESGAAANTRYEIRAVEGDPGRR